MTAPFTQGGLCKPNFHGQKQECRKTLLLTGLPAARCAVPFTQGGPLQAELSRAETRNTEKPCFFIGLPAVRCAAPLCKGGSREAGGGLFLLAFPKWGKVANGNRLRFVSRMRMCQRESYIPVYASSARRSAPFTLLPRRRLRKPHPQGACAV